MKSQWLDCEKEKIYVYIHTYVRTYIHIHTYIHTYYTYIHTSTYIHAYMHTYCIAGYFIFCKFRKMKISANFAPMKSLRYMYVGVVFQYFHEN